MSPDDLASRGINSSVGSLSYLSILYNIAEITNLTLKSRLHTRKISIPFRDQIGGRVVALDHHGQTNFNFKNLDWNPGNTIREETINDEPSELLRSQDTQI